MTISRGASRPPPRILIVDGSRSFLRTLEGTLRPDGYEIRTAADALAALAEIAGGGIDLVVTEITLPGLSGFDLIRRIRLDESAVALPIVLITVVADRTELDRAGELGVTDLLIKPVRPQLVRERIRRALESGGRSAKSSAKISAAVPDASEPDPTEPVASAPSPAEPAPTGAKPAPETPPAALATPALPASSLLDDPRLSDLRLPVFPPATHLVLELLGDRDTTVKQVARVVESDPVLSSSVLKVVNSACYGLRTAVDSVSDACALLGLRDLGSICLGATVSELLLVRDDPLSRDCWALCIATGYASHEIGDLIELPRLPDLGIAGILHGVGILAIVASPRIDHRAIRQRVEEARCSWAQAERELLGFDHAELGGAIARQWRLPGGMGRVIEVSEDPAKVTRPDEWAVAVASLAVQRTNDRVFPRHPIPKLLLDELARLRPNLWERVEPRIEAIAAAAWEQPDPAGVLVPQD